MAIEATNNNNNRISPFVPSLGGVAIGAAGGTLGARQVLNSKLKKTMESADSFSKSKKAPEIVSTMAEEAKSKLKTAQDDIIIKFKQVFKAETGDDPVLPENISESLSGLLGSDKYIRETAAKNVDELLRNNGFETLEDLEKAAADTPEQTLYKSILAEEDDALKTRRLSEAGYEDLAALKQAAQNNHAQDLLGEVQEVRYAQKHFKEFTKQDLDELLKGSGLERIETLEDLEKAAADTPEQTLYKRILAKRNGTLKAAGYDMTLSDFWQVSNMNNYVNSILKLNTNKINELGYENIETLREAAKNGDKKAMDYLNSIIGDYRGYGIGVDVVNEDIARKIALGDYDALKKQIAEETTHLLDEAKYSGDWDALSSLASKKTPAQELFAQVQEIEDGKKFLRVAEQVRPVAEAITGTADKPGLEATSEALERASKATDPAGIKSSLDGVWGNIKDSAESAYKTLNKKTARTAGILGAAALGIAGYIFAKSKNSEK